MRVDRRRVLWRCFGVGFAVAVLGGAVLFVPTLEFMAVDLIEKLGLPIGMLANAALYAEAGLFVVCGGGLVVMGLQHLLAKRR